MQQLVGFAGQRFYIAMKWIELLGLAAAGALFLLFVARYGEPSTRSWIAVLVLVLTSLLITLFVSMQSWLLKTVAVRLGFTTKWWSTPLAVGLAAAGAILTLLLLTLPEAALSLRTSGLAYVPASLGWMGGIALMGLVAMRDSLRARTAKSEAQRRRSALEKTASDFEQRQLERVKLTCEADTRLLTDNLLPSPKGRPLYNLASKPWHDVADFPWASELERNFRDILAEALAVLDEAKGFSSYDYPGVNKGGWTSFSFVSQSKENVENLRRCPKTAALLQRVPRYPHFRDAMFSLLEPHREIPAHQDSHNVYLTCHLGLRIPRDTGIRVAGIERGWKDGECLIFDSSYSHTAFNRADVNRLVLLVDFLHPEINDAELAWLQRVGLA